MASRRSASSAGDPGSARVDDDALIAVGDVQRVAVDRHLSDYGMVERLAHRGPCYDVVVVP
jgi:hypothetical protein